MIAPSVVQEVRSLLAEGNLSQRKIARLTGISRGTVGAIAAGKRPDYPSRRRAAEEELPEPAGPPRRCPSCGGMVYMPCRLCQARALKAAAAKPPIPTWLMQPDAPLGLELREGDRARYEEIRLQRMNLSNLEPGPEVQRRGEDPETARDRLSSAFEVEDDEWERDPAQLRELSRTDLWDAFEWEDEEPAIDSVNVQEFGGLALAAWAPEAQSPEEHAQLEKAACDESLLPDSV
jgi:transcriptional regulator with XRE-family HTH domain